LTSSSAILLLTRGQASDRVNAAEALGPRTSLLGQPLPAVLPARACQVFCVGGEALLVLSS